MAVGSGQITVISGLPAVGFFVLPVKKTFKICGFGKYKSRCAMPEGAIAELFQVFLGRLGLRIVVCSERFPAKPLAGLDMIMLSSVSLWFWKK